MDHYLNSCIEKTEQIKYLSNKTFEYSLVYNDDLIPSLETISSESFIQYIEEHLEYLELGTKSLLTIQAPSGTPKYFL